ncbi:MAG: pyridoxal-dependent decarboxylase [Spirochaetes bacterium]|nr:pyridoxal-dependent decarboxylase [Spirochaetota bacterium]
MKYDYSALEIAFTEAKKWLNEIDNRPVNSTLTYDELKEKIKIPLNKSSISSSEVVTHIIESTKGGLLGNAGGRFFAWVVGGALPSALASDWLVSSWDQNSALYACSPATSIMEAAAGEWLLEILDLPRESSIAFTTGCQLAHFTCLSAARNRVLKDVGWFVSKDGLFGAPPIKVITSQQRHGSVDRAVRYLGLGNKSLSAIKTNAHGEIILSEFEKSLGSSKGPVIVVLDAADLNIAAYDSFSELIPIAKQHGAWVHVDGAFGLFARANPQKKHLTEGIELADSWATDAHKWLNVPFDCGFAIIKDRDSHREAMTIQASYIASDKVARDQIDWNPEWSRRARGVPVYAALRELGKEGLSDLIARTCGYCKMIVEEIGKLPGAEIVWVSELNQGLVRFKDLKPNAKDKDHDIKTQKIIDAVNESGVAFFSPTTWENNLAMRVSVVNWRTNDNDVKKTVEVFRKLLLK